VDDQWVSDELERVRLELDRMVDARLLAPFTAREAEVYSALYDVERDLLGVPPLPALAERDDP
jgi:hypothetical protein